MARSVLTAVNQGPAMMQGTFRTDQVWQIALNYVALFCVAGWSAFVNTRR